MRSTIALDTEVYYSNNLKYSLRTQIAEQFCKSHLFDCYQISVCDGTSAWAGHPRDFNWQSLEGNTIISHNAYWDKTCYEEMVCREQAPRLNFASWECSANLTSYLCNQRSLDAALDKLMGIKVSKQVRSDAVEKHWPQDFSAAEQEAMTKYARDDAINCWRLWDKFSPLWPASERRISALSISQAMRGVQIDIDLLDQYIIQVFEMRQTAAKLVPWISEAEDEWEGFEKNKDKPTSTKCIAEQCRRSGIPCPPVKRREGEEAFIEWENKYGPRHTWIPVLSSWRSINKLYGTFLTLKARLRTDGTMPYGIKYFGAHTGRWAGDGQFNMQNMRNEPLFCNREGLMETNEKRIMAALECRDETGKWPEWVKYAIDMRALFIARPGKKMIISDLSQIEPRVLAYIAGDQRTLDLLKTGMSIYEVHARLTMDWTGGKLKSENPGRYKLAKARVLSLGYQAGWKKLITMAMKQARLDITVDDPEFVETTNPFTGEVTKEDGYGKNAREIVKSFRESNPLIASRESSNPGLWTRLDSAFKSSVGSDFVIGLPSGRTLRYEKVRCDMRIRPNPKTGKPERESVFTADVGGDREPYYGGKLTENLVQATARDVFASHLLRLEDAGLQTLFTVHDEAVLEVDKDVKPCDVEHEMSHCPEWLEGCPIGAEAKEVPHYLK